MPQLDMQPQETLRRAGLYDLLRDFLPKLKLRESCLPSYSRKSGKDLVFQSTRIWATTCMDRTLILILVYFVEYLSSNKRQKKKKSTNNPTKHYLFQFRCPNIRKLFFYKGLSLVGRSPGEGKSYPLQYSGLENSMGCIVHGAAKSRPWLRDFHFLSLQLFIHLSSFSTEFHKVSKWQGCVNRWGSEYK